MNRNLDGVYCNVVRNGETESVCFSDLTPEEQVNIMIGKDETWLKVLCCVLANTIHTIGDKLDIVGENLEKKGGELDEGKRDGVTGRIEHEIRQAVL